MEVLVATAIFLFSMVALGRLIILSGDVSTEVQQQAQAAHLAQSKLAEVIAGVVPLSSQAASPESYGASCPRFARRRPTVRA